MITSQKPRDPPENVACKIPLRPEAISTKEIRKGAGSAQPGRS